MIRRDARALLVALAASAVALASGACAARVPVDAADRTAPSPGWTESGVASWYGHPFHGRTTASGEVYDMHAWTAAHPWLPFDTRLRVENRDNGRSVEVRVNDRGPFARGRILDLSRAAAEALGMLGPGTARVRLTVVEVPAPPSCLEVQVGAYQERSNVEAARRRVAAAGFDVREESGPGGVVRVLAGPFPDQAAARRARDRTGGTVRTCRAI